MDQVIWLVTGNKGGVGKSIVAKSMVEWLLHKNAPITIVDGDQQTPDVASTFATLTSAVFDLHESTAWQRYADYLCENKFHGHVVTNLPDSFSNRALNFFERFAVLTQGYGYQIKVLFVLNTLPDGLHLLAPLNEPFKNIFPIKNLFFGKANQFTQFDDLYGNHYAEKTILFPAINPKIMQLARLSNLPFYEFIRHKANVEHNTTYAKIALADWYDSMFEALNDGLEGE